MTDQPQDTGEKLPSKRKMPQGKPFVKGFDPRRNIKGVPKETLKMREHMRRIAAEILEGNGQEMTRLDAMLRLLWTSRNPAHNKLALQVLDPKLLEENLDISSGGEKVTLNVIYKDKDA